MIDFLNKATRNRLMVAYNSYQGNMPKVLTVCSGGILRSPTIAWVLSNEPYNCNTRSCGTENTYALIPIDPVLIYWADFIVCAEQSHKEEVENLQNIMRNSERFNEYWIPRPVYSLNIPDTYETREPALIQRIEESLKEIQFESILKEWVKK